MKKKKNKIEKKKNRKEEKATALFKYEMRG
jgi:hypothetical protein